MSRPSETRYGADCGCAFDRFQILCDGGLLPSGIRLLDAACRDHGAIVCFLEGGARDLDRCCLSQVYLARTYGDTGLLA